MSKEIEMFSPQKNIDDMNYDELRAFVKKFYNLFERFKREYIDTLENLDETNFSGHFLKEQNGMKAKIVATAEKIESTVSKVDLEKSLEAYTKITQTAEAITTLASKGADISSAIKLLGGVEWLEKNGDPEKIYVDRVYGTVAETIESETYYYFNSLSGTWVPFDGDTIYSVFEQTSEGFKLRGNVSIDGSLVTSGTIAAERIDTDDLACTKLYSKGNKDGYYAKISSEYGDFGLYSPDDDGYVDTPNAPHCVWGVYNSDISNENMNFYCSGNNYMGYSSSLATMFAKGKWDFANADIVWGDNAPEGTGGTVVAVFG